MKYFICGFSGCGKSTKLNSIKMNNDFKDYIFVDLDDYIFEKFGGQYQNLGELIIDKGFARFRDIEKKTLLTLLEENKDMWIALGGGTLDEELVELLTKKTDVEGFWIEEEFHVCWDRIKDDNQRPLVSFGEEKLRDIYLKRQELYKKFKILDI